MDAQQLKQTAAEAAVALVEDGMILGLGTGSTAKLAVDMLGKRVAGGLRVIGIPTSEFTGQQARSLGIPISTLDEHPEIDLTIDGADEVEKGPLNLIKGRGGALLREKIVASASRRLVIIVDDGKLVDRLGSHFAVPVEVVPFGWRVSGAETGGARARRGRCGRAAMESLSSPTAGTTLSTARLAPSRLHRNWKRELNSIVGVVEHGLFLGMATQVIVAGQDGVKVLLPQ